MSNKIEFFGKTFKPYLNANEIQQRLLQLANQLNEDYQDKNPLFLAILNGSFIFAADIYRYITISSEITFIKLQSYEGTQTTGTVTTAIGLNANIQNRHIIILEDIIDTGNTLHHFLPTLLAQQPASVKIVALLNKAEARLAPIKPDYTAFEIPNKFVIGYGLDFDGYGRNLPEIMQLDEDAD